MTDEGVPLAQVEVTVPADAPPEVVFDHVAKIEGLGLVDDLAQDWRGGRALVLIAPDAQDGTLITLVADSPADPSAAADLEERIRTDLGRIARQVEKGDGDATASEDAGDVGLDAIRADLEHGDREAPLDSDA